MHPALIKAVLKMRGVTQADIARQCGNKSPGIVYQVIEGLARSKRIEIRIAAATNLPLEQLWPQWYGPDIKPPVRQTLTPKQVADALRAAVG